jgi:hypothetical protein
MSCKPHTPGARGKKRGQDFGQVSRNRTNPPEPCGSATSGSSPRRAGRRRRSASGSGCRARPSSAGWTIPALVPKRSKTPPVCQPVLSSRRSAEEIDAIRLTLEPMERAAAKARMAEGGKGRKVSGPSDTRDKIGAFAGVSGRTVEKIAGQSSSALAWHQSSAATTASALVANG